MKINQRIQNREEMKANCSNCFALCCTALNIIASSDFRMNKAAGVPCVNLQENFGCSIHPSLREKGFKGCTVYDCLGAGQYVSQQIFKGQDWRNYPENASAMYQVFPIVEQLFEIKAFLLEALTYDLSSQLHQEITLQLNALEETLERGVEEIGKMDLSFYRAPIGVLLA